MELLLSGFVMKRPLACGEREKAPPKTPFTPLLKRVKRAREPDKISEIKTRPPIPNSPQSKNRPGIFQKIPRPENPARKIKNCSRKQIENISQHTAAGLVKLGVLAAGAGYMSKFLVLDIEEFAQASAGGVEFSDFAFFISALGTDKVYV